MTVAAAPEEAPVRLNRYLAMAGVAARRKADELIAAGRVSVNGATAPPGGVLVNPGVDEVTVDGTAVAVRVDHVYYAVNKPAGYLSAVSDRSRRPLVTALVPAALRSRLRPVGRLDLDSRGLILLTDDGELSFRLQHPRHHVEKEYLILLDRRPSDEGLRRIREGVEIDSRRAAPATVELLPGAAPRPGTWRATITLRQGWKRQVRRSFKAVGCEVVDLQRVRIGPLALGSLQEGRARALDADEVAALRREVGLA